MGSFAQVFDIAVRMYFIGPLWASYTVSPSNWRAFATRFAAAPGANILRGKRSDHKLALAPGRDLRQMIRLADEYDAAQERGEIKGNGGARNFTVPNENSELPNAADIGLSRKTVFEARQIRDAEKADP